ncbi:MAG: hypothetical protein J07HQW2_01373 [Haloquadratum walsbyi J07HQW2]|uniref:Uncharacterized protein n=1 Tax=Haloquadratum walsbyi J07HQW2 TaxID=1238425 RepID=U1PRH3_9EURY|nr:MAG: hypothetical protein J07HQW2_01373 [Haloquadratum walsbyi J07HQW2]
MISNVIDTVEYTISDDTSMMNDSCNDIPDGELPRGQAPTPTPRASCFCFNDVTCRHRLPNRVFIHSGHSLHRRDSGLSQPSPALSLSIIPEDHETETEHYMTRSSPFPFPIRFEPTVRARVFPDPRRLVGLDTTLSALSCRPMRIHLYNMGAVHVTLALYCTLAYQ